jgi:hypothetical protein
MTRFAITSVAAIFAIGTLTACEVTPPRGPGSIFISSSAATTEPGNFFQYQITVDNGTPRVVPIFENVSYQVNGLAHGQHVVAVSGLPSACSAGQDSRNVDVRGDDTSLVVFSIQCARTTGDLRVTVNTTGSELDADGYFVLFNQSVAGFVPPNGQTTLQFVPAGTHSISLGGVAPNCVAGAAQTVMVAPGGLATVSLTVSCSAVAIMKFVVSASGDDRDVDGLTVRVNQGAATRVSIGTTNVRVPTGTQSWEVGDVQPNCTLNGPSAGSATVAQGDTVTITVDATCSAVGYGTASTVATDPAADTLPNASGHIDAAHDLHQLTTRYAPNWLILVMRFAKPLGGAGLQSPAGLQGVVELDVDENVSTGVPPLSGAFGGSSQQGVDYGIVLFAADANSVPIHRVLGGDTTLHRVPLRIEGDSVIIRVPLAKIGGDDGNLTITSVVGTVDRPTDVAPNSGVILTRPPMGPVVANAISNVDSAASTRATHRARRPAQWPPR